MDECGALKHNIRADCRTANKFAPILCNFTVAMACTVAPCCTVAAGARCVPSQLIYQRGRAHGCARVVLRSAKGGEDGVSEAMLERLRKAEEEAARLREEMAALERQRQDALAVEKPQATGRRIDSADLKRETLFTGNVTEENWLTEKMLGNGLGEQPAGMTEEEKTVVTKRLVLGIVASVGLGALSLVPTETLNLARPQKPLFFYLTPLLRIQGLLKELEAPVSAGEFLEAKAGLSRILGEPNNARQNMTNAKLLLTDAKTRLQCEDIIRDFMEYIQQVDYNKYYETVTAVVPGDKAQQYVDFSLKSLKAAEKELDKFLKLMPTDAMEAARSQLQAFEAY